MSNLKKNIIYQVSYDILILVLPLITSPYIARVLGATNLGIYSYSYSIAYYFQMLAMLGLKYYGTRSIAAVRDNDKEKNRVFTSIFILHAIFSVLSLGVYAVYIIVGAKDYKFVAIIQGLVVLSSLFDINWLFFGLEKFKITVARNTVIKMITVVCIFVFVKNEADLWKYTLIMSLGTLISQTVVWKYAFRYVSFTKVYFRNVLEHIKPMITLFVPVLAVSVLKYMDEIMLGLLGTKADVGYYDNAFKIVSLPSCIIVSVGTVMLPKISNLVATSEKNKDETLYSKISYRYLMGLAIGMSFGLVAIADVFAVVYWGSSYAMCGKLIKILSISIPFTAYANITRTQYLMPYNKDRIYMCSTLVGMVVNLSLNLLLIPVFSVSGACLGTLISEFSIMLFQIIAIRKERATFKNIKLFLFFYVAGIGMWSIVSLFDNQKPTILLLGIEILVGVVVYAIISCIYLKGVKDVVFESTLSKLKTLLAKR